MFGTIHGRFFLNQYLGLTGDDEKDTVTLSELIETYEMWEPFVRDARRRYARVILFTMFETNDVHPDIIARMKYFDKVVVPFDYLKDILERHGVTCESLNFWTSSLIRSKPPIVPKVRNPEKLIFLYNGTNDYRKNVDTLTRLFAKASEGTDHLLIVNTNRSDGLVQNKNVKVITDHLPNATLATLFNTCDYCITCTRGEGVSLLHLEADYFGKPVISHDQGVFRDIKKFISVPLIPLPSKEVPVEYAHVPAFLHKVFYGTWWDVDEDGFLNVLNGVQKRVVRVAIITGSSGQDGYYLQEYITAKGGYHVQRFPRDGDFEAYLADASSRCERIEVYNLAAQSHVGQSHTDATHTFEVNTKGILTILEAIQKLGLVSRCRVFQASSSEMFGRVDGSPQDETTPFNPVTMYGVSKLAAHWIMKHFRDVHGVFACSGILFNHESPRRSERFVTQKIIQGLRSGTRITLGNLEARRDWGHAKDYVEAMWLMLQQNEPSDYVVATGTSHSVRDFIEIAAKKLGKRVAWSETGHVGTIDGRVVVEVSPEFFRPQDTHALIGDPSKLASLGWKRTYDIHSLIEEMLFPDEETSRASNSSR
jgi:GDP-mannose 4,6-dehydratase